MLTERHIDLRAIRSETDGQPLVGYAPSTRRRLSDTLLREGVTPDEHCLVFRPGAIADFSLDALPRPNAADPPLVHVRSKIATAKAS